ncbi:MAG: hypothetical protein GF387_01565 [Candidatus Portnoybacteria bacterium]|nr:hypothetical protein [Candidatus Portnoybacteria bacterium]
MGLEKYHRSENSFMGKDTENHCLGYPLNWEEIISEEDIDPNQERGFRWWAKKIRSVYPKEEAINPMPKSKWSTDLFNMVLESLDLDPEKLEDQGLHFYKTTGSILDRMGVDAMFTYKDPETKKEKTVTIDITENPNKDTYKADIIIYKPPTRSDQEYEQRMNEIAEEIAKKLKEKPGETIH